VAEEGGGSRRQSLGTFIRSQRRVAALSLRQLADMTSVSNAYLSQIERGLHQPSLRVLRSLAKALDVPTTVLLEHAGMDEAGAADADSAVKPTAAAKAIERDRELSVADKRLLLALYERLRSANSR
jgi:transcriptional regulator with XRE-family HTH domain